MARSIDFICFYLVKSSFFYRNLFNAKIHFLCALGCARMRLWKILDESLSLLKVFPFENYHVVDHFESPKKETTKEEFSHNEHHGIWWLRTRAMFWVYNIYFVVLSLIVRNLNWILLSFLLLSRCVCVSFFFSRSNLRIYWHKKKKERNEVSMQWNAICV